MLKRKFYDSLLNWKNTKDKECLLVKGARQIGKTYIIEQFGKENYKNYGFGITTKFLSFSVKNGTRKGRTSHFGAH